MLPDKIRLEKELETLEKKQQERLKRLNDIVERQNLKTTQKEDEMRES